MNPAVVDLIKPEVNYSKKFRQPDTAIFQPDLLISRFYPFFSAREDGGDGVRANFAGKGAGSGAVEECALPRAGAANQGGHSRQKGRDQNHEVQVSNQKMRS